MATSELPRTQLADLSGGIDEKHGPTIGGEGKVHIMDSQLEVTQVTILRQRQELCARSDRHSRQELIRIVLALLDY